MKDYFNLRKSKLLLFALLAMLVGGVSPAWAEAYTESFEAGQNGWAQVNSYSAVTLGTDWGTIGTLSSYYRLTSTYANTGSTGLSNTDSDGNNSSYVVTPMLKAGTITLYAKGAATSSASKVYLYKATKDGDTYTLGTQLSATLNGYAAVVNGNSTNGDLSTSKWKQFSYTLEADGYVAILIGRAGIDDFVASNGLATPEEIVAKPTAFAASNITTSSGDLTWTAGGEETAWQVVYSTDASFNKDEADKINVNTNSYSLTSLSDNTTYYAAVRAYVSETEQSAWVTTNFKTLMAPISSFPWTENFDALTAGIPDGWDNSEGDATTKWAYSTTGHSGKCVRFDSYNNSSSKYNYLKTPVLSLDASKEWQLKFWYKNPKGGDFSVYISNDGGATYTTQLATALTGATDWTEKEISIPSSFTDNVVVVFKGTSNWGSGDAYIYLDDVSVEEKVAGANFAINTDGTTQNIGVAVVNETAEKTFTITNNGTADLAVNVTNATDFTVQKTVRFSNNKGWSKVYLYAWNDEGNLTGEWPGVEQTNIVGQNEYNQDIYEIEIPVGTTKIVINNNSGAQSQDITLDYTKYGLYLGDANGEGKFAGEFFGNGYLTVPATGSTDIKVVMKSATSGIKNGNIVLSFTAVNVSYNTFTIPVSGVVIPTGAEVVDFNTAIPERWDNESNGWSIDNGAAKCTGKKNLTTQKLDFSADEAPFFIMKVKASDSGSGDYVTVEGSSDNGATWTAFDKKTYSYPTDFGANTGDYSSIVVSIPNTVNKLRFNGYYVLIDEIAGLKYSDNDPAMGVYTDAECTAANKVTATSVNADFGFVTADPTPVTYYIKNDGTGTMELSKSDVAGLTVTLDKTSVAAGEKATLTIAMPVENNGGYHGGDVVVTATELGTFTVKAQGVVVEDGKQNLNFATDDIPSTWTPNNWSKNSNGYVEVGYSSSTMQTSTLVANADETLVVVAKQSYTSSSYTFGVKYRKIGDENWDDLIPAANIGTSYVMLHGTLTEAGNYELQFTGNYTQIQRIYGLSKPDAPEMVVYDGTTAAGSTFSFGKVTDENDATHEFTVKNEGLAKLTGLKAELSGDNADHYTVAITGATGDNNDEIAAEASATVTVTQLKDNLGAHSATLTISATGLDSKVIALSGNTVDHTALNIDFDTSSAWPVEVLEHDGWSTYFSTYTNDGYAYNSSSTAASLILTPLTVANTTDKLTFQAKYYSSSSRDLTVRYTTDGGITWNEYECSEEDPKTSFKSQIGYSFSDLEVTNIPVGTVVFDFYGKSIYLDNIAGDMKVTSAPLVSFTTVEDNISGANLKADGTATYTLANKGNAAYVGSVAATNVTVGVTGDDVTFESNTLTVPAGKTATITVTMAFAAPYGEKTGSLAITSESWVGDINESYTATLVDPTDFVEDFTAGKPAGWYSDGWSYTGDIASVNAGVEKPMITELIGAEDGKNTLTFNAWSTSENQELNVYTSTDRKNWTKLGETITLTDDENATYTRTLTNVNQYIKFGGVIAKIDNIKGVKKLAAPAHDLFEVSTTMAATGTPGASYTATVVGVSLRADETDIKAELWFKKGEGDGATYNNIATLTDQAMTVNTNKTFTLTGNLPTEEGDYTAWVTVKKASDESVYFNTDVINFTLTHTHTMAITTFPNAAAVQADDNNQYAGTFFVTVQNTGSAAIAANDVSVSLIDNADAEHNFTATWTAENSNVLYMNTKKDATDIATDCTLKAWCWNTTEDGEWITFTNVNDGFWSLNLNGKTNFKIVRYNTAGTDENPWNNVYNQSGDLTLASGNLVKFNGYDNSALTFTAESMAYLEPTMTTTLKVTVNGTLTDGENANFSFKAKENLSNTYYGNGLTSNLSVTAAPVIELDETVGTVASQGQNRKVELAHTFVEGWNTICVPFALNATDIHAEAKALAFTAYNDGTKELTFSPVTELEANKPYVIYVPEAISEAIEFTGKTVATNDDLETAFNGVTFQGTYAPVTFSEIVGDQYGLTAAGRIAKASASATMKGFRAYFDGNLAGARTIFMDESTGIKAIDNSQLTNDNCYNLQGQKVENLKKGNLYIINGKKTVVK